MGVKGIDAQMSGVLQEAAKEDLSSHTAVRLPARWSALLCSLTIHHMPCTALGAGMLRQ